MVKKNTGEQIALNIVLILLSVIALAPFLLLLSSSLTRESTLVLLAIGRVFYSDFGLFYQVPMDSGLLYDVTTTIDVYVYKGLIVLNDVGRSAAAGFFQSICGFVLVMVANLVVNKLDKDSALF